MPAAPYEVEEAIHEGVEMIFLMAPTKIIVKDGKKKLVCIRMQLGEPDVPVVAVRFPLREAKLKLTPTQ